MKNLIIYYSKFGNTKKLAEEMNKALPDSRLVEASEFESSLLAGIELLVVGSPTYGGQPTPEVKKALGKINKLQNIKVAAFDTRVDNFIAKIFRYASDKIDKDLVSKGGQSVVKPEGFFVKGKEGPLKEGEEKRAQEWGNKLK